MDTCKIIAQKKAYVLVLIEDLNQKLHSSGELEIHNELFIIVNHC